MAPTPPTLPPAAPGSGPAAAEPGAVQVPARPAPASNASWTATARAMASEALLRSLREMRRQPEKIAVKCAMCYEMMASPPDIAFTCPACRQVSSLTLQLPPGQQQEPPGLVPPPDRSSVTPPAGPLANAGGLLAQELPKLEDALRSLPPGSRLDATGLCPHCRPAGQPPAIVLTIPCADCGAEQGFPLRHFDEVKATGWLAILHPVASLDGNHLGLWSDQEAGIASGALYIYEHRYCPACRDKHPLGG